MAEHRLDLPRRLALLTVARRSIEEHLARRVVPSPESVDSILERLAAAFVTLWRDGELRGCVGYVEPLFPLWETVARCAMAAATEDLRFRPVTVSELPRLTISISVLSPMERAYGLETLEIGRHGLLVRHRGRRGLLLPEVAGERAWDRETFLRETCRKAGLEPTAFREPSLEIFLFETERFSETDHGASSSADVRPSSDRLS